VSMTASQVQVIRQGKLLHEIMDERDRQDTKWGVQNHDAYKWLAILGEEVGEVNRAALDGDKQNYREELIQVAAVAMAMVESLDRGSWR
jgi:NTP pyrophosphatase (non-canonical NTP hydrolase)